MHIKIKLKFAIKLNKMVQHFLFVMNNSKVRFHRASGEGKPLNFIVKRVNLKTAIDFVLVLLCVVINQA
jgi:hypothetical protein